jgi:hypothetical protein
VCWGGVKNGDGDGLDWGGDTGMSSISRTLFLLLKLFPDEEEPEGGVEGNNGGPHLLRFVRGPSCSTWGLPKTSTCLFKVTHAIKLNTRTVKYVKRVCGLALMIIIRFKI